MKMAMLFPASLFRRVLFVSLLVAFIAVCSSCGGGGGGNTPVPNTSGGTQAGAAILVTCPADDSLVSHVSMSTTTLTKGTSAGEYFSPATVQISQSGIVKWTDDISDPDPYWYWQIISDTGAWSTPQTVMPGQSVCLQFNRPGTYGYHCASWVRGTIVVQ